MSKAERLLLASIPTSERLYHYPSINPGTLGLVDMKSVWSGAAKNLAVGATIKNLCYVTDPATVGAVALTYDATAGGMTFVGTGLEAVKMPIAFIPTSAMTHYMHTYWLKVTPTNAGANGFSNATLGIGVGYGTAANSLLQLTPTTSSGTATGVSLTVHGVTLTVNAILPLYDGNIHQFAVEYIRSSDGTQFMFNVYIDGVNIYTSIYRNVVAYPAGTINVNSVGCQSTYTRTYAGKFYRARMDDLTLTTKSALTILAEDTASVAGRFS